MENIIIVVILVIILIPAVRTAAKHMRGEGDCCGGPKEKVPKKKIDGTKLYEYEVRIDGMHCDSCKNRIERHLNEVSGIICKVSLPKKTAVVSCYEETDPEVIVRTIERLDFKVVSIERR